MSLAAIYRLQTTEWICFQSKHSIQTSSTRRRACPPNLVRAVPSLAKGIQSAWKIKQHRGEGDLSSGGRKAGACHHICTSGMLFVQPPILRGRLELMHGRLPISRKVCRGPVAQQRTLCSNLRKSASDGPPLCPYPPPRRRSINGIGVSGPERSW